MNVLRSFWVSFTRFKMASVLNVLSLMAAFAVFIIIVAQVRWEFGFNGGIEDSERVYHISADVMYDGVYRKNISRPIGEMIGKSSPKVESYTVYSDIINEAKVFNIGKHREVQYNHYYKVSLDFIDVFSLKTVAGDLKRISEPNTVIIPRSMAEAYFADTVAVGGVFQTNLRTMTIVGVYEDFSENATMINAVMENMGDDFIDNHQEWSFMYFYKMREGVDMKEFNDDIVNDFIAKGSIKESEVGDVVNMFRFTSLDDIYYEDNILGKSGNRMLTLALLTVAIMIILIASVNYINLFMALVPVRIRNVNISKVFGASDWELRRNVIFEGVIISLIAFVLALPLVQMVANEGIGSYTFASLRLEDNLGLITFVALLSAFVGFLAGVFPSMYITSFSPAIVLKGSFGRSAKGRGLRAVLSTFQFVVSITLVIVAMFVMQQNKYIKDYDYGIEKDGIVNLNMSGVELEKLQSLRGEWMKNPKIEDISFSWYSIFLSGMQWHRDGENGESQSFMSFPVDWNYPEFMGMEIVEGRGFIEDDSSKPGGTMIFNETAAKVFDLKVGDKMVGHNESCQAEIVGIVKDFNYRPLSEDIKPMCLYEFGSEPWRQPGYANIRYKDMTLKEVGDYVYNCVEDVMPEVNRKFFALSSFDNDLNYLYMKDLRLSKVINIFSVISILISLLGLFGIVVSETQYRKKEVALRKINGATLWQVLGLFVGQSMRVLGVSALVAVPIAWFVVKRWLEGYAYRVEMHWWVFVLSVLMVVVLVLVIVVSQTWRAARRDAKECLRD